MIKRLLTFLIIFLFCFPFLTYGKKLTCNYIEAIVIKVKDGDTIVVKDDFNNTLTLRLLYIDTPENHNTKKLKNDLKRVSCDKDTMIKMGDIATEYAKELLDGKKVVVALCGKGYYGRYLSVVYFEDIPGKLVNYNETVVNNGFACIYKKANYPKYYDELLYEARQYNVGLWGHYYDIMNELCGFN